ncbi:MAG TPA: SEC-C domain-containing protein [Candidatus Angelobacter sp.]
MDIPNRKIGRNEPCWCNSGKKYKKCHWERDKAPRTQPWEIAAAQRKQYSDAKYCIHAEASTSTCSGTIVKAHTLARRTALTAIAEAGHVYGGDCDFMSIVKNKGIIRYKRIGVHDASTFTGFCSKHDDRTFAPLEKHPLLPTAEQCFLMSYRALCRELYQKQLHHDSVRGMRELDKGRSTDVQEHIQTFADSHELGTLMGLTEMQHHKRLYEELLTKRNYDDYRRLVIHFSAVPDVLSTGGFAPEFDYSGNALQSMMEPLLANIVVSIVPYKDGGVAVLGWEKYSDSICVPFVQSLLAKKPENLGNAVVRLVFEHIENTYLRPSWWERLDERTRNAIIMRSNSGINPFEERDANCLTDDGFQFVNWPVTQIESFFPTG